MPQKTGHTNHSEELEMSEARTMKESVEWHGIVCLGLGRHCGESGSITNRSTVQHPAQVTGDDEVTQPQEYAHTFHTRTHTHTCMYIYIYNILYIYICVCVCVCVYTGAKIQDSMWDAYLLKRGNGQTWDFQVWQPSDLGSKNWTKINFPASCPEMFNQSPRLKIEAWNSVEISEDFWTKPLWNLQCSIFNPLGVGFRNYQTWPVDPIWDFFKSECWKSPHFKSDTCPPFQCPCRWISSTCHNSKRYIFFEKNIPPYMHPNVMNAYSAALLISLVWHKTARLNDNDRRKVDSAHASQGGRVDNTLCLKFARWKC